MYLLIVDSESLIPSFKSSLWILGGPQPTLSRLKVRMSFRVSSGTHGRPAFPCRIFQVQYQRNPRRCQSITVAAFTIQRASRHRDQNWDNATQKRRSAGFSLGLILSLKHKNLVSKGKD